MSENNDFVVNMMDFMDLQCKDQSNNKKILYNKNDLSVNNLFTFY